ncbi:hypothetical protein KBI23_19070 [bacterium]|nr:hypothetical protein [bacterium]MBP9807647.1 hypothetical protein [bacterium]
MYTELIDQPISAIPASFLHTVLFEATTGLLAFHDIPEAVESWRVWFRHMLPGLIVRGDESHAFHFLIESTFTTFFRVYCEGFHGEYEGFRRDVLETLGKAIMMPSLWDEDGESICAQYQDFEAYGSLWPSCSGAISASLFFCLTYLEGEEIAVWVESIFAIKSAYFQAHLLAWLAGSYEILTSESPHFKDIEKATIDIKWLDSWTLEKAAPLIPVANTQEFLKAVRQVLTLDTLYAWLDNISRYNELSEPLASARIAEIVADVILAGEK